jgi:hypothetical protein
MQPGDTHPLAKAEGRRMGGREIFAERIDPANDLVPGHDRWRARLQIAFDDVKVGATDATRLDADPHRAGSGLRHRPLSRAQRA